MEDHDDGVEDDEEMDEDEEVDDDAAVWFEREEPEAKSREDPGRTEPRRRAQGDGS